MSRSPWARFTPAAVLLTALAAPPTGAAPPASAPAEPAAPGAQALTLRIGAVAAQIRDRHASALRYGGVAPRLGVGLEDLDPWWIDELAVTGHAGRLTSSGSVEQTRWGAAVDWWLAPRVWSHGPGGLHVGGRWHTAVDVREGRVSAWDFRSALEAAVSWRHPVELDPGRLRFDFGIGAPLVGALLRPGYASPLDGRSLDWGDIVLAAPHTLRGLRLIASGWWLRPGGSHARLRLIWSRERIVPPHPVDRSELTLDLAFAWSL